ncbi:hypothetical protein J3R82DRAFT_1825 [Butyriboletus roseoflavus]|nr:hypothetical protein J3R82DRAFT_1825 [Butyriboletus roseoflavus]
MDGAAAHSLSSNDSTQENGTHLWIPEPETSKSRSDPAPSSSRAPQLLRERLYVGNLSPTVDEYALIQVFTKFGKIAKLDFLFHKSGLNKGKPRGYAFVEFMNEADAAKALQTTNGKLLRGRKLVVTFAQQAPNYDSGPASYGGRSKRSDATPTALSLAKSSGFARPEAKTSSKIAMMEAKLRQMSSSSPFAERPALPSKPAAPRRGTLEGIQTQRVSSHGMRFISGEDQRTKNESGQIAHGGRTTTLPSIRDAESSDMRIPPSSKQRSIPGVKIVKGGKSGVTPLT